jgi:hypothetical protein
VEVSRLEEARVGGNAIPSPESDDVAGDQLPPPYLAPGAVAEGGRRRRHGVAQSLGDAMGAIGLKEVEHYTQGHDEDDDEGVDPLAEDRGGGARDQQNDDQRICEEQEDLNEAGGTRRPRGLVRADVTEPPARFVGSQASTAGVELREERIDGPVWRRHGERRSGIVMGARGEHRVTPRIDDARGGSKRAKSVTVRPG